MSKKRFIQSVVARSLPTTDKLQDAIAYAEHLWDGLTRAGYGDDKAAAPRQSKDWYRDLSERQRRWFDKFWKAFNYKHDRNGAAMRWRQLGELEDAAYEHIIAAAGKEADQQLPAGQSRKMAQGWLFERRFDDYAPDATAAKRQKNDGLRALQAELKHLEKLYAGGRNPALEPQIAKLQQQIDAYANR